MQCVRSSSSFDIGAVKSFTEGKYDGEMRRRDRYETRSHYTIYRDMTRQQQAQLLAHDEAPLSKHTLP